MQRAQRTHTEEFYEIWDLTWNVADLNRQLQIWEAVYNTVRASQSLGVPNAATIPSGARPCRQGLVERHQCTESASA